MMSEKVRQAAKKVLARWTEMSEDELRKKINTSPKTKWYDLFKGAFGDSTIGDFLGEHYTSNYTQTECISSSFEELGIQYVQKNELYSTNVTNSQRIDTGDLSEMYRDMYLWAA